MKQQVWILFFLGVPLCSSVKVHIKVVNGDVTLSPVGISTVKSVVWKFGINKVAEFDPNFSEEVHIFGNYEGRTTLNKETGKITILKLTPSDSGTFSVEVDSVLMPDSYRLEVLEAVNNVTIIKADSSNSSCELLCTAKPSSGEASFNYVWIKNGQFLSNGSYLTVNKSHLSHSYTCNASNPVSSKSTTVEDICKEAVNNVDIRKADSSNSLCELLCEAMPSPGEGSLNYVWIKNGQFLSNGSHLDVSNSDLSHSYTCNASNPVSWKITTEKAEDNCKGRPIGAIVGTTVTGITLIGFGVAMYLWKKRACKPDDDTAENGCRAGCNRVTDAPNGKSGE
ncbi:CD48 antigen-like isoform X2 [Clupea harengus]|uniref:CD48 antigen-like isoform X2 n=1 Tax=Clupea harengus TaxID=7950 RepID=A0A6P8GV72_CLUHA|nr:CD48 antigen-like isoform X2 [Clupea harengus]XP_031438681.1 CD48 antigen-like isoform X2 [Clupea harengus]